MVHFKSERVSRNYRQTLNAASERVFPLPCPVRERDWVPGWEADVIYSESGVAELGCIFTTQHEGEPKATWVVSRYAPPGEIEFVRITPGLTAVHLTIRLTAAPENRTFADITYTWTALTERGIAAVEGYTEHAFRHQMARWEINLNHYLSTGEMIRAGHH